GKSLRHCKGRCCSVNEQRLIKKWKVICELQRSGSADFLAAIEDAVGPANDRVCARRRSPRESDAWCKVFRVSLSQATRSPVCTGRNQSSSCVIEIGLPIVGLDER